MSPVRRVGAMIVALAVSLGATACSPDATSTVQLPAQVDAELSAGVTGELRAAVEDAMTATGSPGALVGVWVPWAGVWTEGLGMTGPGGDTPTTDLRFKATRVTRAMTCDVLYALVAEGVVGMDDSVTTWLPGYPGLEGVTLRQLCDSTSGLRAYESELQGRWLANPTRVWNPKELVAYGASQGLAFSPGSAFGDTDTAYVLLGMALAKATGKTEAELFDEYVFEPIGMDSSSLPDTMPDSSVLPGYRSDNVDGEPDCIDPNDYTALSPSAGSTAGGVVSDLDDLARYAQATALGLRSFDDSRLENPVTISSKQPAWFTAGGGLYRAGDLVGQYGSLPGYMTAAFADRTTGLTVVVVLNNSRASTTLMRALGWQLAAIASKAPAAEGNATPETGYPWTPSDMAAQVAERAVCS
ncbi:MAG: serine hydrolase domain-containing protein [Microbacterium sp.]